MTTIEPKSSCVTLINVFIVDPERAHELVDHLNEATISVMRHIEGFRTANVHLSTDYAQWDSIEAFQGMQTNPSALEHMGKAAKIALSFDPHLYSVEAVHTR